MGMRLAGPPLVLRDALSIPSEPIVRGSIQVAGDGVASVLLADHQTTGGYPRIAEIASADVPRLAQMAPGASVHFARCSLQDAAELRRHMTKNLEASLRGIEWQYGK
jgi:allophanate hydrolase